MALEVVYEDLDADWTRSASGVSFAVRLSSAIGRNVKLLSVVLKTPSC